jgi:hypothetical protein
MLTNPLVDRRIGVMAPRTDHVELNRLLAAAVINQRFRSLLLNDPGRAICEGFAGEKFALAPDEFQLIASSQAATLADLARVLVDNLGLASPVAQ